MNNLVLGTFESICKDTFKLCSVERQPGLNTRKSLAKELGFLKSMCVRFAILDPKGSVIMSDLRLSRVEFDKNEITIHTFDASHLSS